MKCETCAEWISARIEGTLKHEHVDELERHLAECSRCRAELLFQKSLTRSLKQDPLSTLPDEFVAKVTARAVSMRSASRRIEMLKSLVPAAAMVIGVVAAWVFRGPLAEAIPGAMTALAETLAGPLGLAGRSFAGLFPGSSDLPSVAARGDALAASPTAMLVVATGIGCIVLFWAFSKVFDFLRE
jgi:anti-sigma factor RsiW